MEIIPAIVPASRADLEEKLARLSAIPGVSFVQVDVVDGRFAAPACWPFASAEEKLEGNLPLHDRFVFDADLMVADPEREAERFARAGATRLTIHAESATLLAPLIEKLRTRLGAEKDFAPGLVSIGLALSIETPLALIEPHMARIDYVQLMGIATIGRQHEPFDVRVVPKVEALHKKHPTLPIQIDGGVSLARAPALIKAGATRLVVGSALFDASDIAAAYAALRALE